MEVLHEPKSFIGSNVLVTDKRGIFYRNDKENVVFNLPAGEFEIFGAEYNGDPIKYIQPIQPFPERLRILPKIEDINFSLSNFSDGGKNIANAAIDNFANKIYLSPDFIYNLDTVSINVIIWHELGHYHYKTEWKCDQFAFFNLLREGYNPSQFKVFLNILSSDSIERMEKAINYLEKVNERTNRSIASRYGNLFVG